MREAYTRLYVHLVWATWDRLPLISAGVQRSVYACMRAECTRLGVELLALGGTENHVHVLVEIPSSVSVAALVKQLKGVSSHLVTHGSGESSPFKWQGGYGAFTLSGDDIPACRRYIEDQERHHGTGEFDPERELARRWRPE